MSACIKGTMLTPHEHIAIELSHQWAHQYHVIYTGRPTELVAAGIVTPHMEEKIVHQRAGSMLDEEGHRFDVCRDRSRKNKRAQWESGEPVRFRYRVHSYNALDLPGVRELCPNGLPEPESEKEPLERALANENDATQSWLDRCAASAQQRLGGDIVKRNRAVGRFQRLTNWASVGGILLIPDFVRIRAQVIVARGG